jgi:hypothetical protein
MRTVDFGKVLSMQRGSSTFTSARNKLRHRPQENDPDWRTTRLWEKFRTPTQIALTNDIRRPARFGVQTRLG